MTRPFLCIALAGLFVSFVACVGDDPGITSDVPNGSGGGIACGTGNACADGAACIDGFCCDRACDGVCEACNVAGSEGRCTAVSGKPHHGSCTGDADGPCAGTCNGTNTAACTYPDGTCGDEKASCAAGTASLPAQCKQGTCSPATTQKCSLGCFEDGCLGVEHVAGGYYHTCAALTDGRVRCWGSNSLGQAGQNSGPNDVKSPQEVPGITNAVSVAATFNASCALLGDGTVKCWGSNGSGELGRETTAASDYMPTTVPGITGATFLAGSTGSHFCAITSGTVKCWGGGGSGELGNGAMPDTSLPVTVCQPDSADCPPSQGATFVAGGDNFTCGIFDGKVACWGANDYSQLGKAASAEQPKPSFVMAGAAPLSATYLTAGNSVACAASGGEAKCWGSNGSGRLGNGQDDGTQATPASVCTKADCSAKLTGVTAVTTGDESVCAIADGAAKCWGNNTNGQLGDGNATTTQYYAASSAIAKGVVQVASGGGVNMAVVVDGADRNVFCWGSEGASQCGTGTDSTARRTPVSPAW